MTRLRQSWKGLIGWLCAVLVAATIGKIVANIPLEVVLILGAVALVGVFFVGSKER